MRVEVTTLVPRGVVHDFVPSGHYNTSKSIGLAGTKPENEVCWQLVVHGEGPDVRVCYAGPYEAVHGDGLVRVITDVLREQIVRAPLSPDSTAQMVANKLRDRGLVK